MNGLHSDRDHAPVCKPFTPDGEATWLLSECDPDDPDRIFALCDVGLGYPELGWCSLEEITALRGKLGLPVERDQFFVADKPLSVYAEEACASRPNHGLRSSAVKSADSRLPHRASRKYATKLSATR